MSHDRRSVLAAIGLALPFGIPNRTVAAAPAGRPLVLQYRSFEDAVREAFARPGSLPEASCRRVEVGHSELLQTGVQGCSNDRPFAGFPAGRLRIVRVASEPGPAVGGVRLYVSTVDVALTDGHGDADRLLDFSVFSPAPRLVEAAAGKPSSPVGRVTAGRVRTG